MRGNKIAPLQYSCLTFLDTCAKRVHFYWPSHTYPAIPYCTIFPFVYPTYAITSCELVFGRCLVDNWNISDDVFFLRRSFIMIAGHNHSGLISFKKVQFIVRHFGPYYQNVKNFDHLSKLKSNFWIIEMIIALFWLKLAHSE